MGAIYGEFQCDWQTPVADGFSQRARALAHRARARTSTPSSAQELRVDSIALAWFPAELAYEQVDLTQQDQSVLVLCDGWLDNHSELAEKLHLNTDIALNDLLRAGWHQYGARLTEHLQGGFALLIADRNRRHVLLARDVLGLRSLCYRWHHNCLHVASEEQALFLKPAETLNELSVVRYFATRAPLPDQSFFADIHTVPAGAYLLLEHQQPRLVQMSLSIDPVIKKIAPEDAIIELQSRLLQALQRSAARSTQAAISLSGGVDSNLALASAARALTNKGFSLRADSFGFSDFPLCDETEIAATHARAQGIAHKSHSFALQSVLPLADLDLRAVSRNTPFCNIYRELKARFYSALAAEDVRLLLHGHFSDHLMLPPVEWLSDRWAAGAFGDIYRDYRWRLQNGQTSWQLWRDPGLRRLVRRALKLPIQGATQVSNLTDFARQQLQQSPDESARFAKFGSRARLYELNFGALASFEASGEAEFSEPYGIHTASPFRDLDVIRFLAALPANAQFQHGVHKRLLREALRRWDAPEAIWKRPKSTSLQPVLERSMQQEKRALFAQLIGDPDALWPKYYQREPILKLLQQSNRSDFHSAQLWLCAAFELWRKSLGH